MDNTALLHKAQAAQENFRKIQPLLEEAYGFFDPMREYNQASTDRASSRASSRVFTHVGAEALHTASAGLHRELFPIARTEPWFVLSAGDDQRPGAEQSQSLEGITQKVHAALRDSNFDVQVLPALGDAMISTGVLWIAPGDRQKPLRFSAERSGRVFLGDGGEVFIFHELKQAEIVKRWPQISMGFFKEDKQSYPLWECFYQDKTGEKSGNSNRRRRFVWKVLGKDGECFYVAHPRTIPAVVFRQHVPSGESTGFGRALNALPSLRVLNRMTMDYLDSSRARVLGVFQSDDEAFVADNPEISGGEIFSKDPMSNGLEPVPMPNPSPLDAEFRYQLEQSIMRVIVGPRLPDEAQGARSDFDLSLRQAQAQAETLPQSLRLLNELVVPVVQRAIDILSSPEMRGSEYYIALPEDISVRPKSPLVIAQERLDAVSKLQSVAAARQFSPEWVDLYVNTDKIMRDFLGHSGLDASDFRAQEEVEQIQQAQATQALAQAALSEQAAAQPQGRQAGS